MNLKLSKDKENRESVSYFVKTSVCKEGERDKRGWCILEQKNGLFRFDKMSFEADDIQHTSITEDYLRDILVELRVITKNMSMLTESNDVWDREDENEEVD